MAFADILVWIASLLFVALVIGVGYVAIQKFKGEEDPDDAPFVNIYGHPFVKGHRVSRLVDMENGTEAIKVVVSPRSFSYKRMERTKKKPEILTLFFDKRLVEDEVDSESEVRIINCYHNHIEEYPEGFKKTQKGRMIINMVSEKLEVNDEMALAQQRMRNLGKIASQDYGGEIFKNYSESVSHVVSDKINLSNIEKPSKETEKK